MHIRRIVVALACPSSLLLACSSDPSPSPAPKYTRPAQTPVTVPPENAPPALPKLAIRGQGSITADDNSVACASDGTKTSGTCTLVHGDVTLYPYWALGWTFDHWEPEMSFTGPLHVGYAAPETITAVFTPIVIVDAAVP